MMDELKQQFYEVMHKYQKPFSEDGVVANLTQWYEQKQGLLQLLRKHPLWNEKELAIVFRVEERREIDRITVDETRAAILELGHRACTDDTVYENFETALRAATADYARIPNEYRLDTIRQYLETAAVNISYGYYCEHQRHKYIHLEEMELNAARVAQMVTQQTEHFEYMERQDNFFGGRAYQYSMWDAASERETYKWLSPLPKEAKIKLGTAELIMPHAKIDRQGKVHRYVPKLKAAVLTENAIAVMPDGKKARYNFQKAKCQKVMLLSRALEILNTI